MTVYFAADDNLLFMIGCLRMVLAFYSILLNYKLIKITSTQLCWNWRNL